MMEGGVATLRSYGVKRAHALPREHIEWLNALRMSYDDGRRLFVHAGVNPEAPLDSQLDVDLIWIREPFLSDARNYGRLIVHGHTPTDDGEPDLRINRLNIDTGAVYGGPLTAAVFDEDETMPVGVIQEPAPDFSRQLMRSFPRKRESRASLVLSPRYAAPGSPLSRGRAVNFQSFPRYAVASISTRQSGEPRPCTMQETRCGGSSVKLAK